LVHLQPGQSGQHEIHHCSGLFFLQNQSQAAITAVGSEWMKPNLLKQSGIEPDNQWIIVNKGCRLLLRLH
jgi:hypothetical protein